MGIPSWVGVFWACVLLAIVAVVAVVDRFSQIMEACKDPNDETESEPPASFDYHEFPLVE